MLIFTPQELFLCNLRIILNGKTKAHLVCFLTDIIMIRLSCKAVVKNGRKL